MTTAEAIVIVPRFVRKFGEFEGRVELFLPYGQVRYGHIETWYPEDGHNEADWGYYRATRKPWGEKAEAERLIAEYKAFLQSIPGDPYEVRVRQRLPNDWRERAWRT